MKLTEFLHPLAKCSNKDRVLAVMYYKRKYEGLESLSSGEIKTALISARAPGASKVNVSDVLGKAVPYVDGSNSDGRSTRWALTDTGHKYVIDELGLTGAEVEIHHDAAALQTLVGRSADADVKDYLNEAVTCLKVSALRATVVFVWSASIRTIQLNLLSLGTSPLNIAITKHDQKARTVNKLDDFAYIKDSVCLLAAMDLGLFDKNQKDTLKEALDLRNRCGHPGKYRPGVKKVSSFLEDVITIVFP